MPGTNLVAAEPVLRAARAVRRMRPRIGAYVLMGLALSGWMGFLVLAGVLLATRSPTVAEPRSALGPHVTDVTRPDTGPELAVAVQPGHPPSAAQPVSAPRPAAVLTAYEERRRVQELVRQADAVDHEDGNVSAARSFYEYVAGRGWAPAALALAFTYDPYELQRRGVAIAADPAKARACYIKARELMEAAVTFYLSRLPPGTGEDRC
jgi:hypothetical protein